MIRLVLGVLLLGVIGGGAYFAMNYNAVVQRDADGKVQTIKIVRRGESPPAEAAPQQRPSSGPLRIATFNLSRLDENKLANRQVGDVLIALLPQFEVIALQSVYANNRGVMQRLVELINSSGRNFDFAVAPEVQQGAVEQYSAFLFDRDRVDVDVTHGSTAYSVDDPRQRFRVKPLVAMFRVRGPKPTEAFTFKLINVQVDPIQAAVELDLLDDVYRAVRDSDTAEDDIIVAGDFGVADGQMRQLGTLPNITSAISKTPTTFRGTQPVDNLVFDRRATAEFTGRAEVFDLMRAFELPMRSALQVSEHLPVWAEFSSYEGGQAGRVAQGTSQPTRR